MKNDLTIFISYQQTIYVYGSILSRETIWFWCNENKIVNILHCVKLLWHLLLHFPTYLPKGDQGSQLNMKEGNLSTWIQ
jgi:hypothetical protein